MQRAAVGIEIACRFPMRHIATKPSVTKPRISRLHGLLFAISLLSTHPHATAAETTAAKVDARQITRLVEHALLAQLHRQPVASGASRVEVVVAALDSRLAFTPCAEPIAVTADLSRTQARVNARVSCAAPSPWAIYVPVELRVFKPVSVAARDLQRGDTLGDADIEEREHDVLAIAAALVPRAELAGQQLRRPIPAGGVLSAPVLEQPLLVRRGDRISVDSTSGGVSVSITGEAQGSARRGERVRVRNLQSGRTIDAVVVDAGRARMP